MWKRKKTRRLVALKRAQKAGRYRDARKILDNAGLHNVDISQIDAKIRVREDREKKQDMNAQKSKADKEKSRRLRRRLLTDEEKGLD